MRTMADYQVYDKVIKDRLDSNPGTTAVYTKNIQTAYDAHFVFRWTNAHKLLVVSSKVCEETNGVPVFSESETLDIMKYIKCLPNK